MIIINGLIAFRLVEGKYDVVASGVGLVLNVQADKVLPVKEEVARQPEKVYFDGKNLRVKPGERLRTLEELNAEDLAYDEILGDVNDDAMDEIVEVIE